MMFLELLNNRIQEYFKLQKEFSSKILISKADCEYEVKNHISAHKPLILPTYFSGKKKVYGNVDFGRIRLFKRHSYGQMPIFMPELKGTYLEKEGVVSIKYKINGYPSSLRFLVSMFVLSLPVFVILAITLNFLNVQNLGWVLLALLFLTISFSLVLLTSFWANDSTTEYLENEVGSLFISLGGQVFEHS